MSPAESPLSRMNASLRDKLQISGGRTHRSYTRRQILSEIGGCSILALITTACSRNQPPSTVRISPSVPPPASPTAHPDIRALVCKVTLPTGTNRLVVIDPAAGIITPVLNPLDILAASAVIGGQGNRLFFSSETADGATILLGMDVATGEHAEIGRLAVPALIEAVASTGDQLFLADFSGTDDTPVALPFVPIPARWQPNPAPGPVATRAVGQGELISQDGRRWYRLSGLGTKGTLDIVAYSEDAPPMHSNLHIPSPDNYYTLLAAPDDRILYIVDYRNAMTIHVVDAIQRALVRSVAIRAGDGTKGTLRSATLAPDGSLLYTIGSDASHGIIVVDTTSLRQVASFLPGQPVAELVISPDGRFLYATSYLQSAPGTQITTIDTHSGNALGNAIVHFGIIHPLLVAGCC